MGFWVMRRCDGICNESDGELEVTDVV